MQASHSSGRTRAAKELFMASAVKASDESSWKRLFQTPTTRKYFPSCWAGKLKPGIYLVILFPTCEVELLSLFFSLGSQHKPASSPQHGAPVRPAVARSYGLHKSVQPLCLLLCHKKSHHCMVCRRALGSDRKACGPWMSGECFLGL